MTAEQWGEVIETMNAGLKRAHRPCCFGGSAEAAIDAAFAPWEKKGVVISIARHGMKESAALTLNIHFHRAGPGDRAVGP